MSWHMFQDLLRGALITIEVTAVAALIATVVALIAGTLRLSRNPIVRALAGAYIEVFRGTSALVQLYVAFFVLPYWGITLSPFVAGSIICGLNSGSYAAEIVRAGIQAVPKGQREAALALDMPRWKTFRHVILPNAVVIMIRPAGNQLIDLLKLTSLVSLVTLRDLTQRGQELRVDTGDTATVYFLLLVFYFAMSSVLSALVNLADRRARRGFDAAHVRND